MRSLTAFLVGLFCFAFLILPGYTQRAELKGKFYEGRFIIYASDQELAVKIGYRLRKIYEKVIKDIGYSGAYRSKYQIFIWRNKEGFQQFLKTINKDIPLQSKAIAIYTYQRLPTIAGYFDEELFEKNLPHEFTHLILEELLRVPSADIPLWLNEGLATYQEKISPVLIKQYLRRAIEKDSFLGLKELIKIKRYPSGEGERNLFYLEAQQLVSFLLDKRKRRADFFSFMRWYVVKEYPFIKAYLYTYGGKGNISDIEKEWVEYIMK